MSRRLGFRYIEVSPATNDSKFISGYGYPLGNSEALEFLNESFLPRRVNSVEEFLKSFK